MASELLFDIQSLDFSKPLFNIDEIRLVNPQRHEMEQLTAVVHVDQSQHMLVGYKDVTEKEFWISGHMPGFPLMPGVVQCESAGQLGGLYARKYDLFGGD
ncbi:MAG: 3-hydroxyacyl-ACP dehydratase FabZ family protein [Planctomyces sp.]